MCKTYLKINNLKISQILASLREVERRQLADWLNSPAHNTRAEVVRLYNSLVEYLHVLKLPASRQSVFRRVFPGQIYRDQQLRTCCTHLLKAIEEWLLHQPDSTEEQLRLLSVYRYRQLGNLFEHQYRKVEKRLAVSPHRQPEYYWQKYQLARERYAWDSARGRTEQLKLSEQEELLHLATLGFKLRQAYLSLAQQQISAKPINIPMLDEMLESASEPVFRQEPMINVYSLAIQLSRVPEDDLLFQEYTNTFTQSAKVFTTDEARDLLLLAINIGIRRINAGQHAFLRPCWLLFQQGLKDKLLLENGKLNAFTYNNIAGIAIRLQELDWAENFLQTYRSRLETRQQEPVYTLNVARLHYTRRNYTSALRLLKTINDRDLIHHMSARVLQLKIFVDTQEIELAINHIRNTRTYLSRQGDASYHVKNYRNILRLIEAWCKLAPLDRDALSEWKKEVSQTTPLTEKEWMSSL